LLSESSGVKIAIESCYDLLEVRMVNLLGLPDMMAGATPNLNRRADEKVDFWYL